MPPKAVKRNRSVSASEADASIPKRIAVNRKPNLWLQLDTALTSVLPVGLSVRLMVFESSRRQLWEVRLFPLGELWIQAPQLERFRDRPVGRVTAVALEDLDLHKIVADRFTAPAARVADRFNDEDECDSEVASVAEEEVVPQAFPAEASITRSEFQTFMLAVNQQLAAIQQKLSTSQPQGVSAQLSTASPAPMESLISAQVMALPAPSSVPSANSPSDTPVAASEGAAEQAVYPDFPYIDIPAWKPYLVGMGPTALHAAFVHHLVVRMQLATEQLVQYHLGECVRWVSFLERGKWASSADKDFVRGVQIHAASVYFLTHEKLYNSSLKLFDFIALLKDKSVFVKPSMFGDFVADLPEKYKKKQVICRHCHKRSYGERVPGQES
eukprot:gene664-biopygen559